MIEGTDTSLVTDLAFWAITVVIVVSAIAVVQLKDLFRAALFLIVTFLGVAAMFVLLRAEFIAGVQLMVYVGAISVLIIFAILLTRDLEQGSPSHSLRLPVALVSIILMILSIYSIRSTSWNTISNASTSQITEINEVFKNTIPGIGEILIRDFVLPFEVVSVLLLAAVIGALAIVRER